jgi:hypothetical protein
VLKEDVMLFDLEELYMLRNNLKSYGQQIQLMFKNKQTNKINEAKRKQNQKPHKQKQMKKTRVNSNHSTQKTRHMSVYIRVLVKNLHPNIPG